MTECNVSISPRRLDRGVLLVPQFIKKTNFPPFFSLNDKATCLTFVFVKRCEAQVTLQPIDSRLDKTFFQDKRIRSLQIIKEPLRAPQMGDFTFLTAGLRTLAPETR